MAEVEEIRKQYSESANFAIVYIKEAHPDDEWQMDSNLDSRVVFEQPRTFETRLELARTFVDSMGVETETFVDDIRNTALACYAAWPERIYVIDTEGRILYKGGIGPFYFDPDDLRKFLSERNAP